jgi:hypothetical protein
MAIASTEPASVSGRINNKTVHAEPMLTIRSSFSRT